ncbi:hypothetical protein [Bacillus timonensis]|uniref:hypothetical protein n=1 Tax=Bacillus timonensis TaxID=1033734 RepID=UPI00028900C7|nr:hypothetical protein [Bacillus timonensis]
MKGLLKIFAILLVITSLIACSAKEQVTEDEKLSQVEEGPIEEVKTQEVETTLTSVPVMVGAHPRCCVGIDVVQAEYQTNPNLLIMDVELRNLLGNEEGFESTTLYLGYSDRNVVFRLLTDQGVYEGFLFDNDILKVEEKKNYEIIFPEVKGNLLGLSIMQIFEESQVKDGSYLDDRDGDFAYLEEINEDMMKRIGREMFDKATSLELARTEEEAWEIQNTIFDRNYPPEIADILLQEITYGDYSDYEIEYVNEQVEFKDQSALIQYEAQVEITLYDKNGVASRTKGFGVSSLIGILPDTGDYYFAGLNYDYLTGTDVYWDVGE